MAPSARYIGSVSRPLDSSQWSVCSRRNETGWAAKNAASTRFLVASQATALAPFSQNSAWLRSLTAGSPQAQLGQSNPSAWFTRSRVRSDRAGPISDSAYRIETATPGTPTAAVSGSPIRISSSSSRASLIASTLTEGRHVGIVAIANDCER